MDLLKINFTIYDNPKDTKGRLGSFGEFLQLGLDHKADIDKVRELAVVADEAEGEEAKKVAEDRVRAAKQVLPCATISGIFTGGHKAECLQQHSGIIAIDIDHIADPKAVMRDLEKWDIIAFASLSASGRGVWCAIPLQYPEQHLAQFRALEKLFAERGITIDQATKDVSRLRFVSYDPEAFYRPDAIPFAGLWKETEPKKRDIRQHTPKHATSIHKAVMPDVDIKRVEACVREIQEKHIDLCPDNETWHTIAFSLSTLGEAGRDLFHIVAEQHSGYNKANSEENNREFDRGLKENHSITIATFFDACNKAGVRAKKDVISYEQWFRDYPGVM